MWDRARRVFEKLNPLKTIVTVKATRSCPTLCSPRDCSPPGSSVHGILQARILGWGAISSSRGIFPTQGSNPGLPHCRWILYHLNHQGSPPKPFDPVIPLVGLDPEKKSYFIMIHTHLFSGQHYLQYPRHGISQNVHPQNNEKKNERKVNIQAGTLLSHQQKGMTPLTAARADGVIIMRSDGRLVSRPKASSTSSH